MKAVLVIDIADDVAEKYDVLTVDYTLRGDNVKSYDWIDYKQDVELKVLPQKKHDGLVFKTDGRAFSKEMEIGWNACIDAITGETAICGDNRFKIIDKAKKDLIENTNIEMSPDEMKVIDNLLFRCWQIGWLKKYDTGEKE